MEKLKLISVKEGKFCLEGKVVDADILGLDIIPCMGFDTPESLKETIEKQKPEGADAYGLGKRYSTQSLSGDYVPILYVRVKN